VTRHQFTQRQAIAPGFTPASYRIDPPMPRDARFTIELNAEDVQGDGSLTVIVRGPSYSVRRSATAGELRARRLTWTVPRPSGPLRVEFNAVRLRATVTCALAIAASTEAALVA
jgi:hypothetical protein